MHSFFVETSYSISILLEEEFLPIKSECYKIFYGIFMIF